VTRLLLWRHGQTAWNAGNRVQGQLDVDLSDIGRAQAETAAPKLAALHPDLLVASDLRRAVATAAALAALTGLDVIQDPRLRERCYGAWQGHDLAEIQARWPAEYARWRAGEPVAGAGVEDVDDVGKRVAEGLLDATARAAGGTVVVATHGGAVRHGCAHLLGWPPAAANTLGPVDNCHWTELRHDTRRGWQLRAHNVG
jgi:glucosyl-3-phosphoglycerate phosphatase